MPLKPAWNMRLEMEYVTRAAGTRAAGTRSTISEQGDTESRLICTFLYSLTNDHQITNVFQINDSF